MNEPKCPYCGEEMKHTAPRLRVKPCGVGVTWQCRYFCESCGSRAPLVDIDCETESELIQAARAAALRHKPKEAAVNNLEYLRTMEHYEMANAILNIGEDPCQLCPRNKEDRCNEDCNNGLVEWLASPVNPDDPAWTEH